MLTILDIDHWERDIIPYRANGKREKLPVCFMPRARGKIGLVWGKGHAKEFVWWDVTRRLWRKTANVYTLRRMLTHMVAGYDAVEIPTLARLLRELGDIDLRIVLLSSNDTSAIGELRVAFGDAVEMLESATATLKERACDQLEWALAIRDSRGRLNRAVLRTRNTTARRRLEARMEEVLGIKAWVAYYLGVVEHAIWALEHCTTSALRILDPIVWDRDWRAADRLSLASYNANQLVLPPFRFIRHCVLREIGEASNEVRRERNAYAYPLIRRAWEGLEMKHVRAMIENVLLALPRGQTQLASDERKRLIAIIAQAHNALRPSRITEKGFRYPGKRDDVRGYCAFAIKELRKKSPAPVRNLLRAAAETL